MIAPTKRELNAKLVHYRQLAADRAKEIKDLNDELAQVYEALSLSIAKKPVKNKDKAMRHNTGKPQLSFILDAPTAMNGLAEVFAMGSEKYERDNWKKGLDKNEIIDSLLRHLMAFKNGEAIDSESGKSHTHHVHWNALVLAEQFSEEK